MVVKMQAELKIPDLSNTTFPTLCLCFFVVTEISELDLSQQ